MTRISSLDTCASALALALATALVAPPGSAVADAPRHARISAHVDVSGQVLSVQVKATGGSHCALRIVAGHSATAVAPITIGKAGRGAFHWTIPASAPSGTWTFFVSCVRHGRAIHTRTRLALINHDSSAVTPSTGSKEAGGKGGSDVSCAEIATPPGGEACFTDDPFAAYQGGQDVGQCTWYAAGMRPDLDGITTGNAGEWLKEASGEKPEGTVPVPGAIAVNTTADGGLGHVAYVVEVKNGGATLILDEANLKYDEKVYLNIETPASDFQGYIYGGPAGDGPGSSPRPAPTPEPSPSPAPAPGPAPSPSGPAPASAQTYAETTGGVVHTWSDYADAGGIEGPEIPANDTVQITCKVTGFTVEDGNTWWYRIASAPWSGEYYGSADAFYNNGQTSGSLLGTPFVDSSVPSC